MRSIILDAFDASPSEQDVPIPAPGHGEVLVRVVSSSVNPVDLAIAGGHLRAFVPHELPLTMGRDVAGVVEAVGPGVRGLASGDEVLGFVMGVPLREGAWAEFARVPAAALARKPAGLGWLAAGALPLAGSAAWRAVEAVAPAAGETVLVIGATGGVGRLAVQLARRRGARVLATGRAEDAADLRSLGAQALLDRAMDLDSAVRAVAPGAVEAVVDLVGRGDAFAAAVGLLRPGGRIATTQGVADAEALAARGVRGANVMAVSDGPVLAALGAEVAAGALELPLGGTFPLARFAEAMARLRGGGARGKLAIVVDSARAGR